MNGKWVLFPTFAFEKNEFGVGMNESWSSSTGLDIVVYDVCDNGRIVFDWKGIGYFSKIAVVIYVK